jgi:WhiB family redox-sensing transcriptional regulator
MLNVLRPPWMADAACTTVDTNLFFPGPGKAGAQSTKQAKAICRACPVVNDCVMYAMSFPARSLVGIWGGMTERERTRYHKSTTGIVYVAVTRR